MRENDGLVVNIWHHKFIKSWTGSITKWELITGLLWEKQRVRDLQSSTSRASCLINREVMQIQPSLHRIFWNYKLSYVAGMTVCTCLDSCSGMGTLLTTAINPALLKPMSPHLNTGQGCRDINADPYSTASVPTTNIGGSCFHHKDALNSSSERMPGLFAAL